MALLLYKLKGDNWVCVISTPTLWYTVGNIYLPNSPSITLILPGITKKKTHDFKSLDAIIGTT